MKDFGIKYTNYTTNMKCFACGSRAETVSNKDAVSDLDRVFHVTCYHKPDCQLALDVGLDISNEYVRYPATPEEIAVMEEFKNRKR